MSDIDAPERAQVVEIDVRAWVETAAHDPIAYRDRQVTEIVLTAIGVAPSLKDTLVLKGGTLMALAFDSRRLTADVDFTALVGPERFDELLSDELNRLLPRTAIELGYLDLVCRVQSIRKLPRPQNFEAMNFPALQVRIGSALRNTPEERRLAEGQAPRVIDVEISFRDQVYTTQDLSLIDAGVAIRAFTIHELIAEKFRALLQQPIRNRNRRQDVYDIAYLVDAHPMDDADRTTIHRILLEKCATRDIRPDAGSLENDEVVARAEAEWDTLRLEVADLQPFADRFALAAELYRSLPWDIANTK
ncbi:nucleotidyl transferase AbiEii/AbiGii toxin family protein [Brevundimonas sp. NPDC090276]|uniref:nucleotidyl transferase AbiEii/AbiGii toxin family protein n=1 Tax=Brevundimonas sp. NPDC090276 TaxID=3363956 RepID=UPI00383BEF4D